MSFSVLPSASIVRQAFRRRRLQLSDWDNGLPTLYHFATRAIGTSTSVRSTDTTTDRTTRLARTKKDLDGSVALPLPLERFPRTLFGWNHLFRDWSNAAWSAVSSSSLWWTKKLPKGLEDFFPKDAPSQPPGETTGETAGSTGDSATTSSTTSTTTKRSGFASSNNSSDNGDKKKQEKPPPPLGDDDTGNLPGLLILLALVVFARAMLEPDEQQQANTSRKEITFVDFRTMLLNNQVEKLQVVNKQTARVFLKPDVDLSSATSLASNSSQTTMTDE